VTPRQASLIATLGAGIVRTLVATLRFRIEDRAQVLGRTGDPRLIWLFWHNRLFVVPHLLNRYLAGRPGSALTSASKDGEVLAAFLQRFNVLPIRGSSSRRGATALRELIRVMQEGYDVAITPDGPRGPCYTLSPGALILAQKTGSPVMPIRIRYSRFWQLKSWDRFQIPTPFCRVDVELAPLEQVRATATPEEFEAERLRLEAILREGQD
jgi:lysophospholipid acyltransferase (LPLAT)-like uncharacterized protein